MESSSSTSFSNSVAYYNGLVYTVDPQQQWAAAFIVNEIGVFETVGSNEDILSIARQRKLVLFDLRKKFIMPGLHDAHAHMYLGGMTSLNESIMDLEVKDPKIAQKIFDGQCRCSHTGARGEWIIGNSYVSVHFPNGIPDRRYIDEVFPDTPVLVREISGHKLLLNSEGLKRLEINENTPDPEGGWHARRPDGTLTGELVEAACSDVWTRIPIPPMAHIKRAMEHAISICHRFGITSSQEAMVDTVCLQALRELEIENRLAIDIYPHILCAPGLIVSDNEQSLSALLDIAEGFRSKHIHPNFVKFVLDGSPIPPNFTQADIDENGQISQEHILLSKDRLLSLMRLYDARGMTCKIHAAGEGSVRMALDVLEELRALNEDGPRHEIAHCNAVHPDDYKRFATSRVTAEMSPGMFHLDIVKQIPDHLRWDFSSMLNAGALLTIGSDWILPDSPDLLLPVGCLAESLGAGLAQTAASEDGLSDLERGSRALLNALTLAGATAVGQQHRVGSIEVGKKANFIAVSTDLSKGHFADATVLQTWYEGRIVYSARTDVSRSL